MIEKTKIVSLLCFLFLYIPLPAQNQQEKTQDFYTTGSLATDSLLNSKYKNIKVLYDSVLHVSSDELLNGRAYKVYFSPQVSTPFIPAKRYPTSTITAKGNTYKDVMLQYDTYKDQIVYFDPKNLSDNVIIPIAINRFIIDEFNLIYPGENMRFKYLIIPENVKNTLSEGFFEIVNNGPTGLVIKHRSVMEIREGQEFYIYKPLRYLVKDGIYYRITGKRSLVKALSDKKAEVRKFIRSLNISVASADKDELARIVRFYDRLKTLQ